MNWFDYSILHAVNSCANRSWVVDAAIVQISNVGLLVGGLLMILFWWVWTEEGKASPKQREILLINLFATTFAVVVARVIAAGLPFRERPLHYAPLHFQLPYTMNPEVLLHWSSFPSDHAVVSFCVAAGLWMVSRRVGAWAIAYAALINLPRIYLGIHYPTDILAGALLGIAMAELAKVAKLRTLAHTLLDYMEQHPRYLYSLLFLWTFEIGEMFDSLRQFGVLGVKIVLRYPRGRVEEVVGPILVAGLLGVLSWLVWSKHHSAIEEEEQILQPRA